jgi:pyridoxal phosphate enzyme (YggS family)
MVDIAAQLAEIQERAGSAARRAGREPDALEIMAVTKTFPAEVVRGALEAGQILFGENKVQEAAEKIPLLPSKLRWHLIGHLQRNKVRKALPLFEAIHGIDSLKLAKYAAGVAAELGLHPGVYLQVNIGREDRKHGFHADELKGALEELLQLERLEVLGLMSLPPVETDPGKARRWFSEVRELRDALEQQGGVPLPGLSMGMSHDYELAIEEGATVVRVGSAVFGNR